MAGVEPVFIDVGSFEPAREGEPWAGYRQFCQTLLYPLLLQAHLGVDFQPWLRARVDGIEAEQIRPLFRGLRRLLPGVPTHVHLHGAMQRRHATASTTDVRAQLRAAGYSRELALAGVRGIERLVDRLDRPPSESHWADYQDTCGYSAADRAGKERFVEAALTVGSRPALVLDLGANDGRYARLAARHADQVVAVDQDPAVVDRLYRRLRADRDRRILPLVMDLADPSPGGGWRGVERASFADRAGADVVLALAVVHHLAIGRNVPLPEVVDHLVGLARPGGRIVVEFVHPQDPMARRLLDNKPAGLFPDYRPEVFARLLAERCRIERRLDLPSGTRTLHSGSWVAERTVAPAADATARAAPPRPPRLGPAGRAASPAGAGGSGRARGHPAVAGRPRPQSRLLPVPPGHPGQIVTLLALIALVPTVALACWAC